MDSKKKKFKIIGGSVIGLDCIYSGYLTYIETKEIVSLIDNPALVGIVIAVAVAGLVIYRRT